MPPFELNPERAQKLLDSVPVTYLIFEDNFTKRYVSLVIQAYPNIWRENILTQHGSFKVYERAIARIIHHRANTAFVARRHPCSASQLLWPGGVLRGVKMIKRTSSELLGQVQLPFVHSCHARNVNNDSAPETAGKKSDVT